MRRAAVWLDVAAHPSRGREQAETVRSEYCAALSREVAEVEHFEAFVTGEAGALEAQYRRRNP